MDIQPLNGILNGIGSGGEWEARRQLQQLVIQWPEIVGSTVAQHSRPLEIHNGTLQVATATAVWAQNLSFERRRILKKLSQKVGFQALGLREIRFSTAQWHNRPGSSGAMAMDKRLHSYQQQLQWQQHPSRLPPPANERPQLDPAQSASQAFGRWSQRRQQQVNQVPSCPQCKVPAPEGELERWGICSFCMTQHWQAEQRANQPDGKTEVESWKAESGTTKQAFGDGVSRAGAKDGNGDRGGDRTGDFKAGREVKEGQSGRGISGGEVPAIRGSAPFITQPRTGRSPWPGAVTSESSPSDELKASEQSSKLQSQLQPISGLPPVAWPSPSPPNHSDASKDNIDLVQPPQQSLTTHRSESQQNAGGEDFAESQLANLERSDNQPSRMPLSSLRAMPQLSSLSQELDVASLASRQPPSSSKSRPQTSTPSLSQAPANTKPQSSGMDSLPSDVLSSDFPRSQSPKPLSEPSISAQPSSFSDVSPNPELQRQAVWSQAFCSLKAQEVERQVQRAELERRTAERLQQVKGKRQTEQPQNSTLLSSAAPPSPTDSSPSGQTSFSERGTPKYSSPAQLSSGRARPLLKRQQSQPPNV